MVGRPFRRSGSVRETLLEIQKWSETFPEVWNWSGDPSGGPEAVGRPSRRFGSARETLPEVWKWSGDPPGDSNVVGRPSRRVGCGQETFLEV